MILFEEVRTPRYPSVEAVTAAFAADIESWGLPQLGVPFWEIGAAGAYLELAEYGVPRPDPTRVVTPDPALPAFERILSLLSGGIKARAGKLNHLPADDTANALMQIFRRRGVNSGRDIMNYRLSAQRGAGGTGRGDLPHVKNATLRAAPQPLPG